MQVEFAGPACWVLKNSSFPTIDILSGFVHGKGPNPGEDGEPRLWSGKVE